MEFLMTFISFIVVYILGKFIYDTYITDNTEKNWEEYERGKKYDETIKQINHSNNNIKKGYNKKNEISKCKKDSLAYLANEYNTSADKVETLIYNDLVKGNLSAIEIYNLIESCLKSSVNEACLTSCHKSDTSSGIMHRILIKYVNSSTNRETEIQYFSDETMSVHSLKLKDAINYLKNLNKLKNYLSLDENNNIEHNILNEILYYKTTHEFFEHRKELYEESLIESRIINVDSKLTPSGIYHQFTSIYIDNLIKKHKDVIRYLDQKYRELPERIDEEDLNKIKHKSSELRVMEDAAALSGEINFMGIIKQLSEASTTLHFYYMDINEKYTESIKHKEEEDDDELPF